MPRKQVKPAWLVGGFNLTKCLCLVRGEFRVDWKFFERVGAACSVAAAVASSLLSLGGDGGAKKVSSGCAWVSRFRQRRARLVRRRPFESGSFIAGTTLNDPSCRRFVQLGLPVE